MIGIPNPTALRNRDFGQAEALRICIYKDVNLSDKSVEDMVSAIGEEFASFGLRVEVPWIQAWPRPAFAMEGIIRDIAARPLESPCDRLFALVGRNYKDFLWGIVMPEVLGAIEDITMSKGYVVAVWGSFNQVLSLQSPAQVAVHEAYHLLGCGHGLLANPCYDQIVRIKRAARNNRQKGQDFFPAMTSSGKILWTRGEVDRLLGVGLRN